MTIDSDSPQTLLDMLNDLDQESKPNQAEPGVFYRRCFWVPELKVKHYTSDAAGEAAWEKSCIAMHEAQRALGPAGGPIAQPLADDDTGTSSRPIRIVR